MAVLQFLTNDDIHIELLRGRDGRDGRDGEDGHDGHDGVPGPPGTDGHDGAPGPPGIDGQDGHDGVPGVAGLDGKDGERGEKGDGGERGVRGEKGDPGTRGPQGLSGGGVTYTRWGRTTCPGTPGTELVYAGIAAGSWYNSKGGGANYLCLPEVPLYSAFTPGVQTYRDFLYGTEYETGLGAQSPLSAKYNHNVPCAICYVSTRASILMVPARNVCPAQWTLEYSGYLMSNAIQYERTMFECVDKDPESVPGSSGGIDGALFYNVEAKCHGIPCGPYVAEKELTCAVCTR